MKRVLSVILLCMLVCVLLSGCMGSGAPAPKTILKTADLNADDVKIGVISGMYYDIPAGEKYSKAELKYYDSVTDAVESVENGQIDALLLDEPLSIGVISEKPALTYLIEEEVTEEYAFSFQKTEEGMVLCKEMNAFLAELRESGALDGIINGWIKGERTIEEADASRMTEKDVLRVVVCLESPPFSHVLDEKPAGILVELVSMFARRNGYRTELMDVRAGGEIAALLSGKCDMIAGLISVTEERKESILFSDPYYYGRMAAIVRAAEDKARAEYTKLEDFERDGAVIGVKTGAFVDEILTQTFPNAELRYFENNADCVLALRQGKVDGMFDDEPIIQNILREFGELDIAEGRLLDDSYGIPCTHDEKGKKLSEELSEYLAACRNNGELGELLDKWTYGDPEKLTFDIPELSAENGTLTVGCDASSVPFCYMANGEFTGALPEFIYRFAREYGYGIRLEDVKFAAMMPSLATKQIDCMLGSVSITEERKEEVYFSDAYYDGGVVALVRKSADKLLLESFNGRKIGVMTGSVHEAVAARLFPDSPTEFYSEYSDLAEAVKNGNVDAFTADVLVAEMIGEEVGGLKIIDTGEHTESCALAFPKTEKGNELRAEFNEFLAELRADGTFDEVESNWLGTDASQKPIDTDGLEDGEPLLVFATSTTFAPFSYMKDNRLAGIDVDLAVRFCRAKGYGLRIETTGTLASIVGFASGMYDFIGGGIMMTEERKESMNFADPDYTPRLVLGVKDGNDVAGERRSVWESVKDSFEKNFIREQRWKLVVQGIRTTVILSVASAVLGTVLGFFVCLMRRSRFRALSGIARVYIRILQGTPILVLLMILFYVVFAHSPLTGEMVAVVAFALNFAAYISEIMRSGIDAVDAGQTEAALAIGFTPVQAFLRIVFPQAARRFLPVYCGEFISLVKSTSVVGYIAVQDLTKMSDIIRSRTYDAFFPLIVTAVIYFIISDLLTRLLQAAAAKLEPNRKKRTVKGVTMQ